jgi:hypothetical protein
MVPIPALESSSSDFGSFLIIGMDTDKGKESSAAVVLQYAEMPQ